MPPARGALARILAQAGHDPRRIETTARVHFQPVEGGFGITHIELSTEGEVDGIDAEEFQRHAEEAKLSCPVSRALEAVETTSMRV